MGSSGLAMLAVLAAATSRPPGTVDVLSMCAPLPQSPASGRPPVYILVGVAAAMQPLACTTFGPRAAAQLSCSPGLTTLLLAGVLAFSNFAASLSHSLQLQSSLG